MQTRLDDFDTFGFSAGNRSSLSDWEINGVSIIKPSGAVSP